MRVFARCVKEVPNVGLTVDPFWSNQCFGLWDIAKWKRRSSSVVDGSRRPALEIHHGALAIFGSVTDMSTHLRYHLSHSTYFSFQSAHLRLSRHVMMDLC